MTTAEKVIKTKVGLLGLGKQLGNVSKACRVMGLRTCTRAVAKQRLQQISRSKPNLRNRIAAQTEKAVVELAIEEPAWGQVRAAN